MMRRSLQSVLVLLVCTCTTFAWDATWESLDSRPLPSWYDKAKFGVFLHWGVFSVPAYGSEWFWQWWYEGDSEYVNFVEETETRRFAYQNYAHRFDATFYDPRHWADVFAKSGAQYVVLTSKHHEGFCNWDSTDIATTWNWNAMDIGPRRDLLGDLSVEIKNATSVQTNQTLKFGVYHSMFEWFNRGYRQDQASNWTRQDFVNTKTLPELYELVNKYEPELIWSDGSVDADSEYWKSKEFLAWYATESPVADTAVWNDRWGRECMCQHGGFVTCQDRYQPGKLVQRKWENALTVDTTSWGWNRNSSLEQYLSVKQLVDTLIETVAYNGNMLLNIGPRADGILPPVFVDRLYGIGEWLSVNGDAIYGTRPWSVAQHETASHVYYTTKKGAVGSYTNKEKQSANDQKHHTDKSGDDDTQTMNTTANTLFAIMTKWPKGSVLYLAYPDTKCLEAVSMLGVNETLHWGSHSGKRDDSYEEVLSGGLFVELPLLTPDRIPSQHAWVVALQYSGGIGCNEPSRDNVGVGADTVADPNLTKVE